MARSSSAPIRITELGSTEIKVPKIGTGTNRWAYGENDEPVFQTYRALQDKGINFFDTAEIYTGGRSERLLGECIRKDGRPAVVASKYRPSDTRRTKKDFKEALKDSLNRLGIQAIDLYYVHMPPTTQSIEDLMDYMAEAWSTGKIHAVGVSNFTAEQMRRAMDQLEKHGLKLAANQVEYSLINRVPETNGVLETCRKMKVSLVAYRPLGRGQLAMESKESKLNRIIRSIAEAHGGSVSQVALNWILSKEELMIPIPGATKMEHALENIGALDWTLSKAEFKELDEISS